MERLSPIIFGNFTEEEQLLYFSDEAVKSSGIEFPEDFHFHTSSTPCTCCKPDYTQTDSEISSTVENVDNNAGLNTENELRENLCPEKETPREFLASQNDDQAHDNNEVVDKYDISQDSNLIPTTQEQIVSCGEKNTADESAPNNVTLHNNVENGPEPVKTSAQSDNATNVVTVGTKTMLTTSTRTVESRNEGVKSSWADLFKTKPSSKPQGPLPKPQGPPQQADHSLEDSLVKKDQFQQYFLDVLRKVSLTNQVPSLQPRGLKNNGNWCYINSTLQVLLFCPSFYHFLMKFKLKTERGTSHTPILDALVLFASQFNEMPPQQSTGKSREWNKQEIAMGMPFEPRYVYKMLSQVKTTLSQQGKQEDAEEFLSYILNGLHDEMVQLTGNKTQQDATNNDVVAEQVVGDWEQVGPRNRSTVTRKAAMSKSPVAAMFGGYLRSSLVQAGMKESASIQPFFTIPLDLRGEVNTVQQAFDNFFRVEEVEGFQCDKSKTEVEVSKKWTLDTLPVVLVLHLKRFVVNKNGCEKLTKKISYEPQLQVPGETLSKVNKVRSKNMLTYKLFAVTYHHGKNLHGGHYTSDISHPAVGWLRADDINVRLVPPKYVFHPLSNRDPYLLYYCRGDI
jgi:ubiquitin carboxyl-terminal hydrolase 10